MFADRNKIQVRYVIDIAAICVDGVDFGTQFVVDGDTTSNAIYVQVCDTATPETPFNCQSIYGNAVKPTCGLCLSIAFCNT
jgi:hypothetical protein